MSLDFERLRPFTGSATWYRHSLIPSVLYTDGAKYLADLARAYWLLDYIALAQRSEFAVRAEEFQVWKLNVKDSAGTLNCEDGNDRIDHTKAISFTDFPEPGIILWCANQSLAIVIRINERSRRPAHLQMAGHTRASAASLRIWHDWPGASDGYVRCSKMCT
jgi:hypothetical protein